jgi:ribosomal protein L13
MFAPHMDTGDHVIVVNADGVRLTGNKEETKVAYRHSGHPGGITATKYGKLLAERPVFAVEKSIRGMLPKNRLGRAMFRKLQVYGGPEHPHQAQRPQAIRLGEVPKWEGLPAPAPAAPAPERPAATRTATKRPATPRTPSRSAPARASSSAQKSTARKTTAEKTTAKKTTAKRTTAKSATAKTSAKRTTARRTKKES